jgi:hypothetical protein
METAFIFLVLMIILIIIGFGGYFVYDYIQYKKTLESELEDTKKNIVATKTDIANEKKTRLGNLKHVVDQVNDTNLDIYNTFTSNAMDTRTITDSLTDTQSKMLNGLNSVIRFSNATVGAGANPSVNIIDLPGSPTVNMELLKQVNVLNGMTFKELSATKNVKFCGLASDANTPARCMEFPNADGKTVLTNLIQDKPIVMNGNTEFSSNVLFASTNGGLLESTSTAQPLTIRSNKFVQVANQLAVGDATRSMSDTTLPTMAIYSTDATKDAIKVSTTTNANALRVDSNGRLILANDNILESDASKKLLVQTPKGMRISAPSDANIELQGNVNITGNITVNGVPLNVSGSGSGSSGN